ncbi:leucine-rich repeat-containing protein 58 [Lycorma delicatula]|uniref:leucine-rich repeat-containing protein 58 n=1 Tax=Lycorma delicatula TaxID=130591 RepID=UPI003F516D9E
MEQYSSESSSDGSEDGMMKTLDFSYKFMDSSTMYSSIENLTDTEVKEKRPEHVCNLNIQHNLLTEIPENISKFCNLRKIDMSNNTLSDLSEVITKLPLQELIAKNNNFEEFSLPKTFDRLISTLQILNLSGNRLKTFPDQIFTLTRLKYLYLGQNQIKEIPTQIYKLERLEILSLGGNNLYEIPKSLCQLHELQALILSDNELESLPACIANLKKLRALQLHRNKLKTLPTEIVTLKYLSELSLRENPLVIKFVNDMMYDPPTLQEISARVIKLYNVVYDPHELPKNLVEYLSSGHHCLNPNCKGVYFDNRVEHVKFVDFCGKYRVPLLQYLCSSKCIEDSASDDSHQVVASSSNSHLIRKVLLG